MKLAVVCPVLCVLESLQGCLIFHAVPQGHIVAFLADRLVQAGTLIQRDMLYLSAPGAQNSVYMVLKRVVEPGSKLPPLRGIKSFYGLQDGKETLLL